MRAKLLALPALLMALGSLGACSKPTALPELPGLGSRIAFDYQHLDQADLDYLSRFDVVVTHDLAGPQTVERLKKGGAKLFFYEWLPALYYTDHPGPWERQVHRERRQWTLDPEESDPDPMGKKIGCKDYFYDMADDALLARRVEHLARKAKSGGYDGIFFDWGSGWHALEENGYRFATAAFQRRHPGVRYDDRVNAFLGMLRAKGLYIALNGAFRSAHAQLEQHADLDVVESMFTSEQCQNPIEAVVVGEGAQSVCETSFTPLSRALELAARLPREARSVNPKVRFLFLNYALPHFRPTGEQIAGESSYGKGADRQALYFGLALSYLGDASGFSCGPDVSLPYPRDGIYLQDLGAPAGPPRPLGQSAVLRPFARGFVIAGERRATLEVAVPAGVRSVRDLYAAKRLAVSRGRALLELAPEEYPSGSTHPMGRIYLYDY